MNKLTQVPWKNVSFSEGFWGTWQQTNSSSTVNAVYNRFYETGRIHAMSLEWQEGKPDKPHEFWDSDVAKWMEGAAYILYYHPNEELSQKLENIIDLIEKGQHESGYFNSFFLTLEPNNIFTDRSAHELYTAGHMIEAAVAHYYSTGSERFLNVMTRFADCIEDAFVINGTAKYTTCGHQEIELALVRLWQATEDERYLELSKHFVDSRGLDPKERVFSVPNGTPPADPKVRCYVHYNDSYAQDDAPARQLPAAAGHAVRAMYYYSSMADLSREYDDKELYDACLRLWNDATLRKMYVTGGVSADRYGEAIGAAFTLPNAGSYAETCASIAMAFFAQRMFSMEPDARFTDIVELQMFNGALVGLSLDGTGFFYDNALESSPAYNDFSRGINDKRLLFPHYRRERVFECSCCPPNILRFIGALGEYVYATENDTVYVSQYAQSKADVQLASGTLQISQETNYPWTETVTVKVYAEQAPSSVVAFRIPGWCTTPSVTIDGTVVYDNETIAQGVVMARGYVYVPAALIAGGTVVLNFPMKITELEANPLVTEDCGKIAIMRGPIVYCVEAEDNAGVNVFDLTVLRNPQYEHQMGEIGGVPMVLLNGKAAVRSTEGWTNTLYRSGSSKFTNVNFTAIPYFAWANREAGDMSVWLNKETTIS
ncbi:glycoside hydrolase family 127 protein [Paenibacillus sp. OV219]|uniref:glycoside hydrolase family 127 protein n=1 Tax=Paenibacillus sp. OV219 TaxID=1884377 RepID=UPI0008BCC2D2|nr:beta-L-arabinofuranosidase domain-containing protein [Paenibacillus sp. OV219]SEM75379.1 hypothetical protein SAMN05518847_101705 [Paenibacillus sp. OV219]